MKRRPAGANSCSSGGGPLVNGDAQVPPTLWSEDHSPPAWLKALSVPLRKVVMATEHPTPPPVPGMLPAPPPCWGGHFPLATPPPREQFRGEGGRPRYRWRQGGYVVRHPHRPGNPSLRIPGANKSRAQLENPTTRRGPGSNEREGTVRTALGEVRPSRRRFPSPLPGLRARS